MIPLEIVEMTCEGQCLGHLHLDPVVIMLLATVREECEWSLP